MSNLIITTITSIVSAILASFLTNLLDFRRVQIKYKIDHLTNLSRLCLKLDSAFKEYIKRDELLGSSYYGNDNDARHYTDDKLSLENKLIATIDDIDALQNNINDIQLKRMIQQYIQLFRNSDGGFVKISTNDHLSGKENINLYINKKIRTVNSICNLFKNKEI